MQGPVDIWANIWYYINIKKIADVAEWQTQMTQNHPGNHGGSSPFIGTKFSFAAMFVVA